MRFEHGPVYNWQLDLLPQSQHAGTGSGTCFQTSAWTGYREELP